MPFNDPSDNYVGAMDSELLSRDAQSTLKAFVSGGTLPTAAALATKLSSGITGATVANTSVLRAMILASLSSTPTRGRIWFPGSSVTAGAGSTSATLYGSNGKAQSLPMQLAKALAARGCVASADYSVGLSGSGSTAQGKAFDSRITGTANGGVAANSMGGEFITIPSGTTVIFTPGNTFDTVEIGAAVNPSLPLGTFQIQTNAGGATVFKTLNSNSTTGWDRVGVASALGPYGWSTTAVAAGSTSVTITNTGAQDVYLNLIGTRTATAPGIEVINMGWGGSSAVSWNTNEGGNGWGAANAVASTPQNVPNVFIVDLLINDASANAGTAAFKTQLNTALSRFKLVGETYFRIASMVADTTDGQGFNVSTPVYNSYAKAAKEVCQSLAVPVIDHRQINPVWAPAFAAGKFRDGYHPNQVGYASECSQIMELVEVLAAQ